MKHCAAVVAIGLAAGLVSVARSGPPPKPSDIQISWQLEFNYETPRMISLKLPGEQERHTYWYVLYKVTNHTGEDRVFAPDFVLYTDTGQILRAGEGVPAAVFTEIQKLHNNPLLVSMAAAAGPLLQGEDNAKDSVAIWRDFDPAARGFDIFVGGLSGEEEKVKLPAPIQTVVRDDRGELVEVTETEMVLIRTLMLQYKLPGEAESRRQITPELAKQQWVMR